jgi:hypothetical protein
MKPLCATEKRTTGNTTIKRPLAHGAEESLRREILVAEGNTRDIIASILCRAFERARSSCCRYALERGAAFAESGDLRTDLGRESSRG